jgi:hypothetical protein
MDVYDTRADIGLLDSGLLSLDQPFRVAAGPNRLPGERVKAIQENFTALHLAQVARYIRALSTRRFPSPGGAAGVEPVKSSRVAADEVQELDDLVGYKVPARLAAAPLGVCHSKRENIHKPAFETFGIHLPRI